MASKSLRGYFVYDRWENIDLAFHIEYEDEPASYPGMTCREAVSA